MALKTYTVTNEPGHTAGVAPAPGLDPAAADKLVSARPLATPSEVPPALRALLGG